MKVIARKRVKEVMQAKVYSVYPDTPIEQVIETLKKEEIDCIPVINRKGKFLGDIHERDLLKLLIDPEKMPTNQLAGIFGKAVDMGYFANTAEDIMKRHEITLNPNDLVGDAVLLMFNHDLNALPVVKNGKIVGILSELAILEQIFRGKR
jgi:CBS domain-containing protein